MRKVNKRYYNLSNTTNRKLVVWNEKEKAVVEYYGKSEDVSINTSYFHISIWEYDYELFFLSKRGKSVLVEYDPTVLSFHHIPTAMCGNWWRDTADVTINQLIEKYKKIIAVDINGDYFLFIAKDVEKRFLVDLYNAAYPRKIVDSNVAINNSGWRLIDRDGVKHAVMESDEFIYSLPFDEKGGQ